MAETTEVGGQEKTMTIGRKRRTKKSTAPGRRRGGGEG